jgi:hypothetical protein
MNFMRLQKRGISNKIHDHFRFLSSLSFFFSSSELIGIFKDAFLSFPKTYAGSFRTTMPLLEDIEIWNFEIVSLFIFCTSKSKLDNNTNS